MEKEKKVIVNTRVIIPDLEKRVLLLKRASKIGNGLWNVPGGKLEVGEKLLQCAYNEVLEETGLMVEEFEDRKYIFDEAPKSKYDSNHYLTIFMVANKYNGDVRINSESSEYRWTDLNMLEQFDFAFSNERDIIKRVYERGFF